MAEETRTDLRALLGEQVWLACVTREITQGDLAEMVGRSAKHVSQAVNGITGSPEFFDQVAATLGMTWKVSLS